MPRCSVASASGSRVCSTSICAARRRRRVAGGASAEAARRRRGASHVRRPCALAPTPMSKGRPPEHLLALEPLPAITRLAVPTTVVMLVAAVSNVLYTYYVSRLGADAIAAVSLVFPISLVAMTAMGGGIGGGTTSAIARALGARRTE